MLIIHANKERKHYMWYGDKEAGDRFTKKLGRP